MRCEGGKANDESRLALHKAGSSQVMQGLSVYSDNSSDRKQYFEFWRHRQIDDSMMIDDKTEAYIHVRQAIHRKEKNARDGPMGRRVAWYKKLGHNRERNYYCITSSASGVTP